MCDHSKNYKCLIWAKLKFHLFWLDTWSVTVSSVLRPSLLLPSLYLTHDRGPAVNYAHSCYKLYLYRQLSYQFLLTKYCKQFVMRVRKKTSSSVSSKLVLLSIKIPVLLPPMGRPLLLEKRFSRALQIFCVYWYFDICTIAIKTFAREEGECWINMFDLEQT